MNLPYDGIPDNRKLVIWIDDDGKYRAHGPMADKPLIYAMCECAKDMARSFKASTILAPTNGEIDRLATNRPDNKPTNEY